MLYLLIINFPIYYLIYYYFEMIFLIIFAFISNNVVY